jgi:hypothetical protein
MRALLLPVAMATGLVALFVSGCGGSGGGGGGTSSATVQLLTTTLPGGTTGASFAAQFEADFPHPDGSSFIVTGGQLPPGLALDSETGELAGTPRLTGEFTFEVAARDGTDPALPPGRDANYSEDRASFTLEVDLGPPNILSSAMPGAQYRAPYAQPIDVAGGTSPYYWEMLWGTLPAGLSVTTAGILGYFPTEADQPIYNFHVRVTDAHGLQDEADLNVGVVILPLIIQTSSIPQGAAGFPYDAALTLLSDGGGPPFTWSQDMTNVAPAGTATDVDLATVGMMVRADGHVTGKPPATGPTTSGTFPFTAQVVDEAGQVAKRQYVLQVGLPPALTSITPKFAYKPGPFQVVGSNFQNGAKLIFKPGATQTQIVPTWISATQLTFSTPPSAPGGGSVTVRVQNPDGGYADLPNGFVFPAATLTFGAKGFLASALSSTGVASGDLNGDGKAEVVHSGAAGLLTGNYSGSSSYAPTSTAGGLHLFTNNGGLSFSQSTLDSANFSDVKIVDVNNDGRLDIVALGFLTGVVKVWLNTTATPGGALSLAAPVSSALPSGSVVTLEMTLGNFNGDNYPDLAYGQPFRYSATPLNGNVYLMAGSATGAFSSLDAATSITSQGGCHTLSCADFDGNGRDDLVIGQGRTYSSYYQSGPVIRAEYTNASTGMFGSWFNGSFSYTTMYAPTTTSVATGDFFGYGTPQVAACWGGGAYGYNWGHFLSLFTLSGTTITRTDLGAAPNATRSIGAADLDFDGRSEVAVSTRIADVLVYRGSALPAGPSATLSLNTGSPTVTNPKSGRITYGDLDGDGKPDMLVTTSYWSFDPTNCEYYYYSLSYDYGSGTISDFYGNGGSMGVVYYLNTSN